MKLCPFCAESIQDAAIKCRHCGSMLCPPPLPSSGAPPWYFRPGMLMVSFLAVGPFMLPLLWIHPRLSRQRKVLWTVIIAIISAGLIWGSTWALRVLLDAYHQALQPL